jgi:hypothetical protein
MRLVAIYYSTIHAVHVYTACMHDPRTWLEMVQGCMHVQYVQCETGRLYMSVMKTSMYRCMHETGRYIYIYMVQHACMHDPRMAIEMVEGCMHVYSTYSVSLVDYACISVDVHVYENFHVYGCMRLVAIYNTIQFIYIQHACMILGSQKTTQGCMHHACTVTICIYILYSYCRETEILCSLYI